MAVRRSNRGWFQAGRVMRHLQWHIKRVQPTFGTHEFQSSTFFTRRVILAVDSPVTGGRILGETVSASGSRACNRSYESDCRVYSIGEFSKITRLTVKTLRFYHEQGLIVPSWVDEQTGYRYYDSSKVE